MNQLIKAQNGGGKKSGKGGNKKYTLRELIGGAPGLGPNGKPLTEVTVTNATGANTTITKPVALPIANATGAPLEANITIANPSPTVNPANRQISAPSQKGTNTSLASAPLEANITIANPSPTVNPANRQISAPSQKGTNTSLASAPEINNEISEPKSLPPARPNNALYVYGTEIPVTTNSNKAITKQRPYMKTPNNKSNNNSNNNTKANKPTDECGACSIL